MERLIANRPAAIIIVAKAPQPGRVKTRLCPPLTYEAAAYLYRAMLLDTLDLAGRVPQCRVSVVCPSPASACELQKFLPAEVDLIVQRGNGLTAALISAFEQSRAAGYDKIICLSSDNPTLPTRYLVAALDGLDRADVVLGPAEDGGYYLVGARQPYPGLFHDIRWSTMGVLAETLRRAGQAGLSTRLLATWYDLDTPADLWRLQAELEALPLAAPFTYQALRSIESAWPDES